MLGAQPGAAGQEGVAGKGAWDPEVRLSSGNKRAHLHGGLCAAGLHAHSKDQRLCDGPGQSETASHWPHSWAGGGGNDSCNTEVARAHLSESSACITQQWTEGQNDCLSQMEMDLG